MPRPNMPKVPAAAQEIFIKLVTEQPDAIPVFCGCLATIGNVAITGHISPNDPAIRTLLFWLEHIPDEYFAVLEHVTEVMTLINEAHEAKSHA